MKRVAVWIAVWCCYLVGCETTIRETNETVSSLQSEAVRVRVPGAGMASLYASSNPDGLPLAAEPMTMSIDSTDVQIGPVDDLLAVVEWSFNPANGSAATLTRLASFRVLVPIRLREGIETRICKFEVEATELDVVAAVGLGTVNGRDVLSVVNQPDVVSGVVSAEIFGDCDTAIALEGLEQPVDDYVRSAIVASTARALEAPLVDALGLLDGSLEVQPPVGTFRNGEMLATQRPNVAGVTIDSDGVSFAMNAQMRADRASCVPPVSPENFGNIAAAPVSETDVSSREADFGIALSLDLIGAVLQNFVLSGVMCFDIDRPLESVAPADIGLADVGLGAVPIDSDIIPVVTAGALPTLSTNANRNQILARFSDLTVELYANVFGVNQRLVAVQTTVTFSLNVRPGPIGFRLNIESADIEEASFFSKWAEPSATASDAWIRRVLIVALSNQLSFPLPLSPDFAIRLVEAEVRPEDVVLYLDAGN